MLQQEADIYIRGSDSPARMMHTKNLWFLWLGASQSVDNGIHGLHGRKHLRHQYGSMASGRTLSHLQTQSCAWRPSGAQHCLAELI